MGDILGYMLSIIGIFVSIYYAKKVQHKKIKYAVAKKDNEYIIAFWNACNHSIFKEDMYDFTLYGDTESEYKMEYSNEKEIPLELLVKNDDIILRCVHKKAIRISFDFLNKRKGYIVYINNRQKSGYVSGKLAMYGRVRGESEKSVQCYKKLYSGSNASIKEAKDQSGMVFMNIISVLISFILVLTTGWELIQGVITYSVVLVLTIAIVTFGGVCYFAYMNSIPLKLNKEYQYFLNKKGYREIKSKDELSWWN